MPRHACVTLFALCCCAPALAQVTFDFRPVGFAGNAPDPETGFGSVGYAYEISSAEVTNAQYVQFLNAKAQSDPFGLYTPLMNAFFDGGIERSGVDGSYTYSLVAGREQQSVRAVNFFNAMRFTNWLANGQGAGDTETGAYTIADGLSETRTDGALYYLPTEDEWYKAAYFHPADQGGDADDYWRYGYGANDTPTPLVDANVFNPGGGPNEAGDYDANFFGLFDVTGNLREWTEGFNTLGSTRIVRGGSHAQVVTIGAATFRDVAPLGFQGDAGFRVVRVIPGPGGFSMILGAAFVCVRRRRVSC